MTRYKFYITYRIYVTLIVQCRISSIISTRSLRRGDSLILSEIIIITVTQYWKIRVQFFLITPKFISIFTFKNQSQSPKSFNANNIIT